MAPHSEIRLGMIVKRMTIGNINYMRRWEDLGSQAPKWMVSLKEGSALHIMVRAIHWGVPLVSNITDEECAEMSYASWCALQEALLQESGHLRPNCGATEI